MATVLNVFVGCFRAVISIWNSGGGGGGTGMLCIPRVCLKFRNFLIVHLSVNLQNRFCFARNHHLRGGYLTEIGDIDPTKQYSNNKNQYSNKGMCDLGFIN